MKYTWDLNLDWERRDIIIKYDDVKYSPVIGDIGHFDNLSIESLEKLIELNFAYQEMTQNDSPSIKTFLDNAKELASLQKNIPELFIKQIKFIGYAVSIQRSDYRVSIEGIHIKDSIAIDEIVLLRFKEMFKDAQELDINNKLTKNKHLICRAWYD